jgi:predicted dehydrogenase
MDYTAQPLAFRLRKVLRYVRLYGPARTAVKVRSQYHMKRRFTSLPDLDAPSTDTPGKHVGIIGCGKFAYAIAAYYLTRRCGRVIRGVMDVDIHRAASLAKRYNALYYCDDIARVIDDDAIDLVYVTSNHASHSDYATAALDRDKHVHVEKPHVVSFEQLEAFCEAMQRSRGTVTLGFNRPESELGRSIQRTLGRESGPLMLNWFVAGHELEPGHWYYRPEEGGRVLGNLCHWTDFALRMVPEERRYPLEIHPARADRSDCDIAVSYVFGDGSIAAITFSSKGHTFEGVRERFSAHRGDAVVAMDDFRTLSIHRREEKRTRRLRYRDHGHEQSIVNSYMRTQGRGTPANVKYVWETGELFLRTREALEDRRVHTLEGWEGVAR